MQEVRAAGGPSAHLQNDKLRGTKAGQVNSSSLDHSGHSRLLGDLSSPALHFSWIPISTYLTFVFLNRYLNRRLRALYHSNDAIKFSTAAGNKIAIK